ncbi:hypothetical protein F511_35844 [Dorcoceras hygrometricum]|uniref:Uncharacterized protein n=1 Tax=Dorcoceras hygrometricum TaxID=472368 RepID=A0A2Z7D3P8_9LAMI|nr:hypothetical protein F511_35844 [Dorcoceras hygrometricum]
MRHRFVVATGSPAAIATLRFEVATGSIREKRTLFCLATGYPAAGSMRRRLRRAAIPHSHLPARIVATMSRVVNYNSSWARQQQVELFDASGNQGSTAGRGFNPAGGAPGGNQGSTAGRGFNPAGGAPGGG